jgi:hypothetical protein
MQQNVITWLAALPLVLAAFRVIPLGDRLSTATATGRKGGESSTQNSAILAGLSFLGLLFLALGGEAEESSVAVALVVLAFGGFVLSYYILSGFRDRQWQSYLAAAVQEAAIYWLVLAGARFLVDSDLAASSTESQGAIWAVITVISVALIVGTFARIARDVR